MPDYLIQNFGREPADGETCGHSAAPHHVSGNIDCVAAISQRIGLFSLGDYGVLYFTLFEAAEHEKLDTEGRDVGAAAPASGKVAGRGKRHQHSLFICKSGVDKRLKSQPNERRKFA